MRRVALLALVAALCVVSPAAAKPSPPRLLDLHMTKGSAPFLGDGSLLTTVSPNGDVTQQPVSTMLDNLWARLSTP